MRSDGKTLILGALKIGLLAWLLILSRHHLISEYRRQHPIGDASLFYSEKMNRFDPGIYQTFTLGFSLSRGFNFDALGVSGLHMLDSGGSYLSALLKLRGLKRAGATPRVIFLPITETSLQLPALLDEEGIQRVASYLRNSPSSIPYWRNDPVSVLSSQISEYIHEKYELKLLVKLLQRKLRESDKDDGSTSCKQEIAQKQSRRVASDGDFMGYADWHLSAPCWKALIAKERDRLGKRAKQGAGNIAENIRIIKEIGALSSDMDAQLVLIRMPVSRELVASLSDIALLDNMEATFQEDPDILYLDYEDFLSEVRDDRIFFMDPLHLNKAGSERFSSAVATELRSQGVLW